MDKVIINNTDGKLSDDDINKILERIDEEMSYYAFDVDLFINLPLGFAYKKEDGKYIIYEIK